MRRGKSPKSEFIHLLWSAWVFVTPLLGSHYSWRWAAVTLASYPVFLLLYARTLLASRRRAWIYPLGMLALAFLLLPWYPSALSYFVFGCVMLHTGRRGSLPRYLLHLLLLNLALALEAHWIGYP